MAAERLRNAREQTRVFFEKHPRVKNTLWRGKIGPAFWTLSSLVSMTVNIILIVILIFLARQLFMLKDVISNGLINGLYDNFVLMDDAHIITTITVSDTIVVQDSIPVVFDLPLQQDTMVTLVQATSIQGATIYLNGAPVDLDIILPEGTQLAINLDMTVPVNQTVPVVLNVPVVLDVPVDIALNQTDLHKPFVGLQNVVAPYRKLLGDLPGSWDDTPLCGPGMGLICRTLKGGN
jgi:hypothetical protein